MNDFFLIRYRPLASNFTRSLISSLASSFVSAMIKKSSAKASYFSLMAAVLNFKYPSDGQHE